jgi:hypothetical protein
MKRKAIVIVIPILIVVVGFVAMRVLTSFRTDPPRRKPEPRPKIVEATAVTLKDVPARIVAYGRLRSSQPVILYSEVQGTLMRGDVPIFRRSLKPGRVTSTVAVSKRDYLTSRKPPIKKSSSTCLALMYTRYTSRFAT